MQWISGSLLPHRLMDDWMLVASEEATSGSVMAKQLRISPLSSGSSQRLFCSRLPYLPRQTPTLL